MRKLFCLKGVALAVNRINLSRTVGWLVLAALFPIMLLAACGQEASEESAPLMAEDTAEMAAAVSQSAPRPSPSLARSSASPKSEWSLPTG